MLRTICDVLFTYCTIREKNASFTLYPTRDEIKILSNEEIDPSIETWIVEKLIRLRYRYCHINEASTLLFHE